MNSQFNLVKEAKRVFDSILLDEPKNFLALYGKALALYKDGKAEECMETLNTAISLEPDSTESNAKDMRDKIQKLIQMKQEPSKLNASVPNTLQPTVLPQIAGHKIGERINVGTKLRTHNCKICDKNFTKLFSLNRHLFLHSGEKPHKCTQCRKAFVQKTDMIRHETTHSDLLLFECNVCRKRFKTKKNLNSHLMTHSTKRPFQCRFCEKDFKIKRLWQFHEGLHKDIKP